MCKIGVVLSMLLFVLESKLVLGSVSISVEPDTIKAPPPAVGDTFTDSIYVSGLTTAQSLAAWQFSLAYNKEVLKFDHFTEGPFLNSIGTTIFVIWVNDTAIGRVCSGACLVPIPAVGAVGSGTICYVTWRVRSCGDSPIHILRAGEYYMETYLLAPNANDIPISDMVDGYFDDTTYIPGIDEAFSSQVDRLALQAYPNPFRDKVVIRVQGLVVGGRQKINLRIYDLIGRLVKSFSTCHLPLTTAIFWDGRDDTGIRLPSSIYFCRLQVDKDSITKQLLMLK